MTPSWYCSRGLGGGAPRRYAPYQTDQIYLFARNRRSDHAAANDIV